MAKITFRDLLVKTSSVFGSDAYLIYNQYFIEGSKTSSNNNGFYVCKLTPEMMELCDTQFKRTDIVYFSDIKKAKDDLEKYVSIVTDKTKIENIKQTSLSLVKEISSTEVWNSFNFTEEEVSKMYDNGEMIELFKDNDSIPTTVLSKSLLPLVTTKNINDLYYSTKEFESDGMKLQKLFLSFDFTHFQLFMCYIYIPMD